MLQLVYTCIIHNSKWLTSDDNCCNVEPSLYVSTLNSNIQLEWKKQEAKNKRTFIQPTHEKEKNINLILQMILSKYVYNNINII